MTEHPILPPPPSADLPPGRHEFHRERLLSLIDDETRGAAPARARRPFLLRPVVALAALTLIVAGVVGVAVARDGNGSPQGLFEPAQVADPHAGSPRGVTELVNRMVLVSATRDNGRTPTGSWVYIRSRTTEVYLSGDADTGVEGPAARATNRQTWRSLDGRRGWLEQTGTGEDDGGLSLDSDEPPSLTSPSYDLLTSLPTDPDELLARIHAETRDAGRTSGTGPDTEAFSAVGDLLLESYPPAALYPALYRAAAAVPGVLVVDDAVDAAGRHGIALARVDERDMRTELIFDKRDYTFLGERRVRTTDADGIRAGTVTFSTAILDRALVGAVKEVPAG